MDECFWGETGHIFMSTEISTAISDALKKLVRRQLLKQRATDVIRMVADIFRASCARKDEIWKSSLSIFWTGAGYDWFWWTFKVVWNFLSLIFQILFIKTRYIYCTAVVIERLRRRLLWACGPTPFLSFMCACGYICRPQVIARSYTLGCDIPAWKWYALGCLWALGQASSLDRYAIVAFTVSSTTSK